MPIPSNSKLKKRKRKARLKAALWLIGVCLAVVLVVFANRFIKRGVESLAIRTVSWTCDEIQIIGGVELSSDSILVLSGCETNHPLTSYSTQTIKERLELNPWIQSATVERRIPNVLYIAVKERTGVALVNDGSNLAVSEDLVLLPAEDKLWKTSLPWLSVSSPYSRQAGKMTELDPLLPVAKEFMRVKSLAPDLVENFAELYRIEGNWGAVLMNPVLSVTLSSDISTENWLALDELLRTSSFQDRLDSNAVVDLRLPGFVTLHLPARQAEES
ncbi:MAG: FtsQ-type POTRA domain-containing protein [Calditrichaeota bacterium]|nr:FtsQ-type POTRA domain-containing protein [Calditrichota bacterium]MCB9368512.1 FtsQ-type POTRA domain-containing protein [Calditrichota bacterium]